MTRALLSICTYNNQDIDPEVYRFLMVQSSNVSHDPEHNHRLHFPCGHKICDLRINGILLVSQSLRLMRCVRQTIVDCLPVHTLKWSLISQPSDLPRAKLSWSRNRLQLLIFNIDSHRLDPHGPLNGTCVTLRITDPQSFSFTTISTTNITSRTAK